MIYKTIDEWIEHNPNHMGALPIEVCHQIWGTKDYKKPWVGLTEEEIKECFTITPDQYLHWHIYKRIEQKLKEKNT
jgi:hypothetical protein